MQVPAEESCRPVKDIVLELCMKDEWRRLIGFDSFDSDGDGQVSQAELLAGVGKLIAALDKNGDGMVSREELHALVVEREGQLSLVDQLARDPHCSVRLLTAPWRPSSDPVRARLQIRTIDADGDGQISKEEFLALIH